jgi:hypothetical protein
VTKEIIGRHPNTYTFSKALAEQYLIESANDLPIAIVRPSIVVASWKHPIPGWIDNRNGPTGEYHSAFCSLALIDVGLNKLIGVILPQCYITTALAYNHASIGNNICKNQISDINKCLGTCNSN